MMNWVNSNVISHSCRVKIWLVYQKDTYDVGLNNQHLRYFSDIDPQKCWKCDNHLRS